jgi:hypothetical protein
MRRRFSDLALWYRRFNWRKPTLRIIAAFVALAATTFPLAAQNPDWKQLEFVLGKWTGVADAKGTETGPGQGGCSFELDLNKKIMVRRNAASYDSGVTHDDLMVMYLDGGMRAIYFDTEGHTIRYNISVPSANRAVFESDGAQPGPKYRLSYQLDGALLVVRFEIAPPGGEYKLYAGGTLKRDNPHR